ncbi:hypothetical protein [Deinococcus radiotolerans]|uniref:DUF1990 domain-containing protein n=1 Tax=Deinococcus radiotolerans TaxID=1309407 RepID=A0ABQ2FN48_9DEIO|nr:hypothetical protein [Deinococcus radiotolerans]GGL10446.1 hypothetical protein GCM10010844_31380 [Deinococcus radiotolerans]
MPSLIRPAALLTGVVLAYTAYLQSPRHPLRPTDLPDGVGPVTHRRYWLRVQRPDRSPEALTALTLQALPTLAPKLTAWFQGLDAPLPAQGGPPLRRGSRLKILMGFTRRARVVVDEVGARHFCLRTLHLHADAGTVTFRAVPERAALRLEVESVVRAASWPDRIAYLLAAHALQRLNWRAVLLGAARLSGGQIVDGGDCTEEAAYRGVHAR